MGAPVKHACPFECGKTFKSRYLAEMHANGAHRTPHPRKPVAHGTATGYRQHQRHGTQTCQPCRDAWADYCRPYQQRQAQA
jgi:hypothetical protein